MLPFNSAGVVIRQKAKSISKQGRDATGVRVMKLAQGQELVAMAVSAERLAEEADDSAE